MCAFVSSFTWRAVALCVGGSFLLLPSAFSQGSLTPPGAPAPTMKTLDQIDAKLEKRTPISSLPFTISAPGSYYLTTSLTAAANVNGININADHVTLDLNGFEVVGSPGTATYGIRVATAHYHVTILNGTVRNWPGNGVTIQNSNTTTVRVERVRELNNDGYGIALGINSVAVDCMAIYNAAAGIKGGDGCQILRCNASSQYGVTGDGFDLGANALVSDCQATGNVRNGFLVGIHSALQNCVANDNLNHGISAGQATTISGCAASNNSNFGISIASGTIKDCTASGNDGDGIQAGSSGPVTIEGCTAHTNQGNGISTVADGSVISTCAVSTSGKKSMPFNTAADGIRITARTRVVNCTSFNNAQHGIENTSSGNRAYIDGCIMQGNTGFAIAVVGNGNVIIRNQVGGNSGGAINQSGGNIAPIQNASDAAGVMHPLANFP